MKITCEHCGCVIDTENDKRCPNCKAPYSNNKEYKELKSYQKKKSEYDLEEKEVNLEHKKLANKAFKKRMNSTKYAFIFASAIILIFAIILVAGIFAGPVVMKNDQDVNNIKDNLKDAYDKYQERNKEIEVSFNEEAHTDRYSIKCDKITSYKYDVFEKEEFKNSDLKVYNFEIVFKNNEYGITTLNDFKLTYTDKDGNENVVAKKHNANVEESNYSLELYVTDVLTHKGNLAFEIPKYVKDVKIVFNKVTINIEDFKNKM